MKKNLLFFGAICFLSFSNAQVQTFNFSGNLDSLQIPNCVDSIIINIWGAQGETPVAGAIGGKGAYAKGTLNVTTGDWIYIQVGGQNGYNGGGIGGNNGDIDFSGTNQGGFGGAGGGASDIRIGGSTLNDRVIVAGGGGGGGHHGVWPTCQPANPAGDGGEGSGIDGGAGSSFACGCGGGSGAGGTTATTIAGGIGGGYNSGGCGAGSTAIGSDGTLGLGGNGATTYLWGSGGGGGGGGGYFGGGAGGSGWDTTPGGGGGGGSSYTGGVANGTVTAGIRSGNGLITITYIISSPIMTTSVGTSGITLTALENSATYQWLNCSTGYSVVTGATNQSFIPSANGDYAVKLNNGNGCIDTSACITVSQVGVDEMELLTSSIYPNPANDNIQINVNGTFAQINVVIFDMKGNIVLQSNQTSNAFILNIESLNSGVYLLQLNADEKFISNTQLIKN